MIKQTFCTFLLLLTATSAVSAQQQGEVAVSAEDAYQVSETETLAQAKIKAVERAKIKALEQKFGTIVSGSNILRQSSTTTNGSETTRTEFRSLSQSDVKGLWIANTREPKVSLSLKHGDLFVEVSVEGLARELKSAGIDLKASVLRQADDERSASTRFRNGDNVYLSFKSPMDGYLAVFLYGEDDEVYTALPYAKNPGQPYRVKGGENYIFFSRAHSPENLRPYFPQRGYILQATEKDEINRLRIVFSPNFFSLSNASKETGGIFVTDYRDFDQWLISCRRSDEKMQVIDYDITITADKK
ncbi:MAG: DUF4384 domain-containing protein [Alloprevotella sp.]